MKNKTLTIRLSTELYEKTKEIAEIRTKMTYRNQTMNSVIVEALIEFVKKYDKPRQADDSMIKSK